jgi:hypothetical protein
MALNASASDLRELDLLVRFGGMVRRISKFAFSKADASLYVMLIGPHGLFRCGLGHFDPGVATIQVQLNEPVEGDAAGIPKISIHESGQVHVIGGTYRSGPCYVPSIVGFRGVHVATILVEHLEDLTPFNGQVSTSGPRRSIVLDGVPSGVTGLRLPLYVNGREPKFRDSCQIIFSLQRPGLAQPLNVGLAVRSSTVRDAKGGQGGVVMAVGWDPSDPRLTASTDILLVRAT